MFKGRKQNPGHGPTWVKLTLLTMCLWANDRISSPLTASHTFLEITDKNPWTTDGFKHSCLKADIHHIFTPEPVHSLKQLHRNESKKVQNIYNWDDDTSTNLNSIHLFLLMWLMSDLFWGSGLFISCLTEMCDMNKEGGCFSDQTEVSRNVLCFTKQGIPTQRKRVHSSQFKKLLSVQQSWITRNNKTLYFCSYKPRPVKVS